MHSLPRRPVWPILREMAGLSFAYVLAFFAINLAHFHWWPVSVILYACLWDIFLATTVTSALYYGLRRHSGPLTWIETGLVNVAAVLVLFVYAILGPTVIDRSLSIYIVETIDQRGGEVAEAAMPRIIVSEFMDEYHVSDVRMTEQVTSETVRIEDGCIHLTAKGKRLAAFTSWYRATLLPKRRRIGERVTDVLTRQPNPDRRKVSFECPT